MKRVGQAVIALVAATGACAGGAAAIASVTGVSPAAYVSPSPVATVQALVGAIAPAQPVAYSQQAASAVGAQAGTGTANGGATISSATLRSTAPSTPAPATHAVSGASGMVVSNANYTTAKRTSVASGTTRTASVPATHGRTGASGGHHEGHEREDD